MSSEYLVTIRCPNCGAEEYVFCNRLPVSRGKYTCGECGEKFWFSVQWIPNVNYHKNKREANAVHAYVQK